jgi:hypothetical protein
MIGKVTEEDKPREKNLEATILNQIDQKAFPWEEKLHECHVLEAVEEQEAKQATA